MGRCLKQQQLDARVRSLSKACSREKLQAIGNQSVLRQNVVGVMRCHPNGQSDKKLPATL